MALLLLSPVTRADIVGVQAWAYQLQDISVEQIAANSTFELIVMDPSADGSIAGEWSAEQIQQIAASGKLPIAYLSIGEAENYRWYWQPSWDTDPPGWLGPENPQWPGNFKVRFWVAAWQSLVFQSLHRIVDQGFAGVYLDVIDAYYFWSEEQQQRPQADADMVLFVRSLADSLHAWGGGGRLVIPQNGEFLPVEDDVEGQLDDDWWQAIDAIGVEDVFCPGEADEDNPWAPDAERLAMLSEYRQHDKTVLSVEYLNTPAAIEQFRQAAQTHDFLPYATVRALDELRDGLGGTDLRPPDPRRARAEALQARVEAGVLRLRLPQPAHGILYIRLFDMSGRLVAGRDTKSGAESQPELQLSGLPAGRYVCEVRDQGRLHVATPFTWIP